MLDQIYQKTKSCQKIISTTFCLEVWPEIILTAENGTLKCRASAIIIAALAWPFMGGSLTQTSKLFSFNFLIDSALLFGFAFTNIFIPLEI